MLAARDASNALWFGTHNGQGWSWTAAQGVMSRDPQIAGPAAVVAVNDSIFVRQLDLQQMAPLAWNNTSGVLVSEAAAWMNNQLYIGGRDSFNRIWWYRALTGHWTLAGQDGLAASELTLAPR